eukprot:symbB.v1.2.014990.t1/scaffold1092.1/size138572/1
MAINLNFAAGNGHSGVMEDSSTADLAMVCVDVFLDARPP